MPKVEVAVLAACLLGASLAGCSHSEPPPINFTPSRLVPDASQAALEAAKASCQAVAQKKGFASLSAIILRRGKSSEADYIECMEGLGYEVQK
jgi:hypothetical protein